MRGNYRKTKVENWLLCECFGRERGDGRGGGGGGGSRWEEEGGQREPGQVDWLRVSQRWSWPQSHADSQETGADSVRGAVTGHRMVRCWRRSDSCVEEAQCTVSTFNAADSKTQCGRKEAKQNCVVLIFACICKSGLLLSSAVAWNFKQVWYLCKHDNPDSHL